MAGDKRGDGVGVGLVPRGRLSITSELRERTHALHTAAERSGIINDVLRGHASRYGYALLLRNLLPAYQRLEAGLEAWRHSPGVGVAARPEVYRAEALESDLRALSGADWAAVLPVLPAGEQYALRVAAAAQGSGSRLISHAYTRYFGDLSGGQVMKRLLGRSLGLQQQELSFYEFPAIENIEAFKHDYRQGLDDGAKMIPDLDEVIAEAIAAFELNIAVSEAVQTASAGVASPMIARDQ
jgi:heme oxygenase (biliverdin-producing, ferredoxin)